MRQGWRVFRTKAKPENIFGIKRVYCVVYRLYSNVHDSSVSHSNTLVRIFRQTHGIREKQNFHLFSLFGSFFVFIFLFLLFFFFWRFSIFACCFNCTKYDSWRCDIACRQWKTRPIELFLIMPLVSFRPSQQSSSGDAANGRRNGNDKFFVREKQISQ